MSVRGQRPVDHWMHFTTTFRSAFETLIEQPWRDEFDYLFTPTIYGVTVDWSERTTRALRYSWGNHIIFDTRGVIEAPSSVVATSRESDEGSDVADEGGDSSSSTSDEPISNGILMALRGDTPVVYRVPNTADYRVAFSTLTEMPWREEYEEHFVPMIGGRQVEWDGRIGTAWTSNIIFHRLQYPIIEPGEWVLDAIPQTPGADHPVWKIATWLWTDNKQKDREAAARARYEAEAGTNTALPSRVL